MNLKLYDNYKPQIIIVDDNSNDGTKELLQNLEKNDEYKDDIFLFKKSNMGKGDSQKLAIPLCSGDFTIIQDADLEYNVENINSLLKLLIEKNHDAVLGYRKLKSPFFLKARPNVRSKVLKDMYRWSFKSVEMML